MPKTPLTKEYLDRSLKTLRGDITSEIKSEIKKSATSIKKEVTGHITKELKTHVTKEVGGLARMVAHESDAVHAEFEKVHRKLGSIEEQVKNHDRRIHRVESAIGIPPEV